MTTVREYWDFVAAVAERLIVAATEQPAKWVELADRLADFPPPQRRAALDALAAAATDDTLPSETRLQIWTELDKVVRQHRKFASAEWALGGDEIDLMGDVLKRFLPPDAIDANVWLFNEHIPDVGVLNDDFSEKQEDVDKARVKAVESVHDQSGFDGLKDLALRSSYPWFVGTAGASSQLTTELDGPVIDLLDADEEKFANLAAGYATSRIRTAGTSWAEDHLRNLADRPLAQSRLLQGVEDPESVWDRLEELGPEIERAYWREFSPMGRGPDFAGVNRAAQELLRFKRPLTALDLLALYARKGESRVSVDLVAQGLEALVALPEDHDERAHLSQYEIQLLLDYLRTSEFDEDRLGLLEWKLLPALGFDARTPTLERRLARDPSFFVEVLSLLYRPKQATEGRDVPEHVASNAWHLLHEWKIVPGSDARQGEIDPRQLDEWIDRARELLKDADRWDIGHAYIGHVFAHARTDDDDTWPSRPVRDRIERLANTHLEDGLATQIYNNRGVTSRGLLDGGEQERDLAQTLRAKASLIRDQWPRTAAVLAGVAEGYEADARRNDADAERWREGLE